MPTIHLIVKGKVQGVFYRATAKKKAVVLGLTGWVQNTPDGNVEITATGTQQALDSFTEWCHEGPSRASVTGMEVSQKEESRFEEFIIIR